MKSLNNSLQLSRLHKGIIEGAAEGKGRGRQVISTARTCNMILIVLDSAKPVTHKKIIEQELFSFGIRINQNPPKVKIVKKENGGKFLVTCNFCYLLTWFVYMSYCIYFFIIKCTVKALDTRKSYLRRKVCFFTNTCQGKCW